MSGKLLITGATGQVGSHLVRALLSDGSADVLALVRRDDAELPVESCCVSLDDIGDHPEVMQGVDCVVHLAAHMGRGGMAQHRRVTVEGTANLLRAAEAAGVPRFLFVSTIAAGFERRRLQPYPYALAKREAEELVGASSLQTLTLRPTLILGPQMKGHQALARLSTLPLTPLFGDAELQPIDVRDVALALVRALADEQFDGRVLEVGGPTRVRMSDLLRRMRRASFKGGEARILPLPGRLIAVLLGVLEPVFRPVLPLTSGQLQTFIQSGIARPNQLLEKLSASLTDLDQTLNETARHG